MGDIKINSSVDDLESSWMAIGVYQRKYENVKMRGMITRTIVIATPNQLLLVNNVSDMKNSIKNTDEVHKIILNSRVMRIG